MMNIKNYGLTNRNGIGSELKPIKISSVIPASSDG